MITLKKLFKKLGPGFITGAADDDPGGIATYSSAGAQFNFKLLWSAFFTLPLMIVVQEMCARLSMVTGRGLAGTFKLIFNKKVLMVGVLLLACANIFNIGADLGMMGASLNLLLPNISVRSLVVIVAIISIILEIFISYKSYAKVLKWLSFSLIAYWITAIMVSTNWPEIFNNTFLPRWEWSTAYLMILVAFLGTTISPYLFFWQGSVEVEEEIEHGKASIKERQGATKQEISSMRWDVIIGMIFSNLSTFFIVITAANTLHLHGIFQINTAAEAALALKPFAGNFAYLLFTLGIIGTGLLAIPVLAGSVSYAIAEVFNLKEGLYLKFAKARGFYLIISVAVIVGVIINFLNLNPVRALIYSAVLNGLTAPIFIWFIMKAANNKKIMGEHTNPPLINFLGWVSFLLMTGAGLAFLISLI
jgi:NRAMP (natural resistance-associated macrophage protein)-like metal ion transporter